MGINLRYEPPAFEFDESLAEQLTRIAPVGSQLTPTGRMPFGADRKSPFAEYARILTPEGGILILYTDLVRGWPYAVLRAGIWGVLTVGQGWFLFHKSGLSLSSALLWLLILGAINLFLVTRKIRRRHSVEIRQDRMILDGGDVFWAEDIGQNWPKLQMKGDPNRMVIAGTCGTRHVEYMTANRLDKCDRTPEVLAADLQDAMQQLWGRTELVFDHADTNDI
jgi:hypothetical protein